VTSFTLVATSYYQWKGLPNQTLRGVILVVEEVVEAEEVEEVEEAEVPTLVVVQPWVLGAEDAVVEDDSLGVGERTQFRSP